MKASPAPSSVARSETRACWQAVVQRFSSPRMMALQPWKKLFSAIWHPVRTVHCRRAWSHSSEVPSATPSRCPAAASLALAQLSPRVPATPPTSSPQVWPLARAKVRKQRVASKAEGVVTTCGRCILHHALHDLSPGCAESEHVGMIQGWRWYWRFRHHQWQKSSALGLWTPYVSELIWRSGVQTSRALASAHVRSVSAAVHQAPLPCTVGVNPSPGHDCEQESIFYTTSILLFTTLRSRWPHCSGSAYKIWRQGPVVLHSSGAVWESRWTSWAVRPNEPSGFRGHKDLLNRASALVTTCP